MPIGCDFICENENCQGYKCRISLHGPWPIADLDEVIAAENDPDRKQALESKKEDGSKYACITVPNKAGIKSCGLRIRLYCPSCKVVWDQDYSDPGSVATTTEELENPKPCPGCNGKVLTAINTRNNGIPCPICSQTMKAKSWVTSGVKAEKNGDPSNQG